MFYFLRTVTLYILLFAGASYAVQKGFEHYYLPDEMRAAMEKGGDIKSILAVPHFMSAPRQTESGLILAGTVAQNRRDWDGAWQNFSTLNDKFKSNPDIALRAFTLAMGNGSYDEADAIAQKIRDSYLTDNDDDKIIAETFDLVWLHHTLQAIKANAPAETLQSNLDNLGKGALSRFASPVITAWALPDKDVKKADIASSIQTYYLALAAEFHGDKAKAINLMKDIEGETSTLKQMQFVVAFYMRLNETEHAIELLNTAIKNRVFVDKAQNIIDSIQDETYAQPDFANYHLQSQKAGIALAFHDFSRILLAERAVDSALLFARMAAYIDVNIPSIHVTIGDILKHQNQDDAALRAYEKTLPTDPLYSDAITQKSDLLLDREMHKQAQKLIEDALEIKPDDPFLHYVLGNIYKDNKAYADAIEQYDLAETLGLQDGDLDKKLWPLYYSRAIAFDLSDDWDAAEKDLEMALEKFPESPIVLNYLGYAYADRGISLERSKEMISRALMAAPNDAYITDSMGWILYRMGFYDQAVKYLERAAAMRPYHMVINDHLGDAYWKQGRKIEAHYMWKRALDYYDETDEEQRRMIDETRRKVDEGLD